MKNIYTLKEFLCDSSFIYLVLLTLKNHSTLGIFSFTRSLGKFSGNTAYLYSGAHLKILIICQ